MAQEALVADVGFPAEAVGAAGLLAAVGGFGGLLLLHRARDDSPCVLDNSKIFPVAGFLPAKT